MKRTLIALMTALCLGLSATAALASCGYITITTSQGSVLCWRCCYGGNCTVDCY